VKTYRAGQPPSNPADLPGFLLRELPAIEQAANRADPYAELQVLAAAPQRLRKGMLVCVGATLGATGDFGYGAGLYLRNEANDAWLQAGMQTGVTAWTPVITASAGAFTTVSASGHYSVANGVCSFTATITITTNGTASGYVVMSLPVQRTHDFAVCGRASVSSKQLQGVSVAGDNIAVLNYDGGYPGSDGESLIVSGQYFVA
jgi:hypothetical protein